MMCFLLNCNRCIISSQLELRPPADGRFRERKTVPSTDGALSAFTLSFISFKSLIRHSRTYCERTSKKPQQRYYKKPAMVVLSALNSMETIYMVQIQ